MSNQLDLLISLYEDEKNRLEKLIEDAAKESEYLIAHYHSKALNRLNHRLRTLNNFKDKFYDEKCRLQRQITAWEKYLIEEANESTKSFFESELQKSVQDLELLNKTTKTETIHEDNPFFYETLLKLIEGKIKSLKLVLKKKDYLFLGFSYYSNTLKISLPYIKKHKGKGVLSEYEIDSLKKLGFLFNTTESKLFTLISGYDNKILEKVKILLSKIVFELFDYREFDNESYIQFKEKNCR